MADVTGPISSLPGSAHAAHGMCDNHPDRPATVRMQGETDSFGSEMYDLCNECAKEWRDEARKPDIGRCDWCKTDDVERRPKRDWEEGMSGPVYYVCDPCRERYDRRTAALDNDWSD